MGVKRVRETESSRIKFESIVSKECLYTDDNVLKAVNKLWPVDCAACVDNL